METDQEELKELPFQLLVKYTDTEGATALRVLTQCQPITYDRREAEKSKGPGMSYRAKERSLRAIIIIL